jgi:hypothetical protein
MKIKNFLLIAFVFVGLIIVTALDTSTIRADGTIGYATLLSRKKYNDYAKACFSFEFGGNGEEVQKLARNDWDLQFGNGGDVFHVTMVTDDRSRIADLGELNWDDKFEVPVLPAHQTPTREPNVKAAVNHVYLVHTTDSDTDFYALFRVESLEAGDYVKISWKRIDTPKETTN